MKDLKILDVSAIVYTAATSEWFKDIRYYDFPVGGIHYLMRQVSIALMAYDAVVLCFDSPTKRKEILPSYKSGRNRSPIVASQIEILYENLMSCGIYCEKHDGYEADDIIHWAVQQLKSSFSDITIIGNDHDLCHEIQSGVKFKSVSKNVASIYPGNFEDSVDSDFTYFNTISAKKVFKGCESDKIPAMRFENYTATSIYKKFVQFLNDNNIHDYQRTTDWRLLIAFANEIGLSKTEKLEIQKQASLVYPFDCPDGVQIVPTYLKSVNKEKLARFLTKYNDRDSLNCFQLRKTVLSEEDKQDLRDSSHRLSSGEFAADRNLEAGVLPEIITKNLDVFRKEY